MVYPPYGWPPVRAAVKRKVFVSYHHDGDQPYYDAFARFFADTHEVLADFAGSHHRQRGRRLCDATNPRRLHLREFVHGGTCWPRYPPAQVSGLGDHGHSAG